MLAGMKLRTKKGVQVALFPLRHKRTTQTIGGEYSHKGNFAIDVNTKGYWDVMYAPFDGKIVLKSKIFNTIIFQSLEKVLWANGIVDYAYVAQLHDNDISDLKVGMVFAQGDKFYDEGGAGYDGKPKYANHIHITVGRGVFNGVYPFYKNKYGAHTMRGEVNPADVFFINETVVVGVDGNSWKEFVEVPALEVGDIVKVIGSAYPSGKKIPLWVKRVKHKVIKVSGDKVLIGGYSYNIKSYVWERDLVKL